MAEFSIRHINHIGAGMEMVHPETASKMREICMTRSKLFFVLLLIIIISAMLFSPTLACKQDRTVSPEEVTFEQLFADPTEYSGRYITIDGIYFHGFEIILLSEGLAFSEFAYGHLVPEGKMIWVEGGIPKNIYDKLYKQDIMGPEERFGKVRLSGKFEYGQEYGHLGGYDSQIIPSEVVIIPWSPPTIEITRDQAIVAAREALSASLGVSSSQIELLSVEEVMWGNTSLGCPEPGKQYAEVIVPGFRVIFEYEGQKYEYHTNIDGSEIVTCQDNG